MRKLQSKADEETEFVHQLCAEYAHLLSSAGQDLLSGEQSMNPYPLCTGRSKLFFVTAFQMQNLLVGIYV